MDSINSKASRSRNFSFVVYDDSAPENWKEYLSDLQVPLCYIYHDKDINPDGTPKKPHYHVLVCLEGVKTDKQIDSLFGSIAANGRICQVNSKRGSARYLCHLDNPEKYQYNKSDVVQLCGLDYNEIISLPTDLFGYVCAMEDFIDKYNILSFSAFSRYCRKYNNDWFKSLCSSSSYVIDKYIKAKCWEQSTEYYLDIDSIAESESGISE